MLIMALGALATVGLIILASAMLSKIAKSKKGDKKI